MIKKKSRKRIFLIAAIVPILILIFLFFNGNPLKLKNMKLSMYDYFNEREVSEEDILEWKVDYDWMKSGQYMEIVTYKERPDARYYYTLNEKGIYLSGVAGDDSFLTNDQ